MPYRLVDFSGDVAVEAEAATPEAALVELGRALAHVLTDGSRIEARSEVTIDLPAAPSWTDAAVAFLNELVYRFETEQFLVAGGRLQALQRRGQGVRVQGALRGEPFDSSRHRSGRGVKAATYHDASHTRTETGHRLHVVLDL